MLEYPGSDTAKRDEGTFDKSSCSVKVQRIHGEAVYSVEQIWESKWQAHTMEMCRRRPRLLSQVTVSGNHE
jgi:hypothetical protein